MKYFCTAAAANNIAEYSLDMRSPPVALPITLLREYPGWEGGGGVLGLSSVGMKTFCNCILFQGWDYC